MRRSLLVLSMVLGASTAVAWADQPKPEAPVAGKPATVRTMSCERLKDALESMGLEVKQELKNAEGKVIGYRISRSANGFDIELNVTVSSSGEFVWITCCLGDFSKSPLPADKAEKLLARNGNTLAVFSYSTKTQRLHLKTYVPAAGFSPRAFLAHLDDLTAVVAESETEWNSAKWQKAETAAAPAPAK